MSRKHKVLVVDDEADIRELAKDFLGSQYEVLTASDGWEAIRIAKDERPSVILLDLLMPRLDGIATCEYLRKSTITSSIPVIMLTALKDTQDRTKAFRSGADDYISKPFHPDELLARVDSKIRRFEELNAASPKKKVVATPNHELSCGNLVMDLDSREVRLKGRTIRLAQIDFALLQFLIENVGKLKSRQELVEAAWKAEKVPHRLLDPHLVSLRKSLKGFDHEIATVWGGGYILKKT